MTIKEEIMSRRDDRQLLTDRLTVEYAGAVAPGQVLAAVLRADRLLAHREAGPDRTALCEMIARRRLAEQAASNVRQVVG